MVRNRNKKSPPKKNLHGCVALVPVDGTSIRRKISRDYEKAQREIQLVRAELRRFESQDRPAFTRWLHRELGPQLTTCRELEQKVRLQEMILFQVQETSFFAGISPKKAYERVMREQEKADRLSREDQELPPEDEPPKEQQRRAGQNRQDDFFEGDGKDDFPFSKGRSPKPPRQPSSRLKDLYRLIVRKLHPDLQKEMTPQKTEWWHQAQAAYAAEDIDQLEIILCFCEIDEQQSIRNTSLSVLQRITSALKSSLRPLRRELKECQQESAWHFSRKKAPELFALARGLKIELEQDIKELKAELAGIEEDLLELRSQKHGRAIRSIDPFDMIFGRV